MFENFLPLSMVFIRHLVVRPMSSNEALLKCGSQYIPPRLFMTFLFPLIFDLNRKTLALTKSYCLA